MTTDFDLLLYLYTNSKKKMFTTLEIANRFNVSQQTASRKLRELEEDGYVVRSPSVQGTGISVTSKGVSLLKDTYAKLRAAFQEDTVKCIEGVLVNGLGEGRYYLGMRQYSDLIREHMCFTPYPGTLNLKADPSAITDFLSGAGHMKIPGFKTAERTFGSLDAYRVRINGKVDGAIVVPERTHHDPNVLEVIAPVFLRERLNLKEGDTVRLCR